MHGMEKEPGWKKKRLQLADQEVITTEYSAITTQYYAVSVPVQSSVCVVCALWDWGEREEQNMADLSLRPRCLGQVLQGTGLEGP